MMHLTPEDMVLCYYGEAGPEPDAHLAVCERCRAEFRELQRVLNQADGFVPPERDPEFESRLWARLERELPRRRARGPVWLMWKPAVAALVLAVAIFLAGRRSAAPVPPRTAAQDDDTVLVQAVGQHFDRSQYLLQEIANEPQRRAPREEVLDLLGANRLYRQTAAMSGEAEIADLLEELEQVLVEVENQEASAAEVKAVLFKLRVARQGLRGERL